MLCERVLGNLDLEPEPSAAIDWLDLSWFDCAQRALRRQSRAGTSIRILLDIGQQLRHGDILHRDASGIIAVNLIPADVLVARPRSLREMGQLAVEVGNLHQPVQITAATAQPKACSTAIPSPTSAIAADSSPSRHPSHPFLVRQAVSR